MTPYLRRDRVLLAMMIASLAMSTSNLVAQRPPSDAARRVQQELLRREKSLDHQLEQAAWTGTLADVKALLNKGANANAKLRSGLATPLLRASNEGRLDVMKLLIARGADVNHLAPDGRTPLVEASMHRSVEPLKLLLDSGAKPTGEAIATACQMNRSTVEKVKLLLTAGAAAGDGMAGAGFAGNMEVLKLLLEHDADVNAQDKNRNAAIHGVISRGDPEAIKFLLTRGANVNLQGQSGNTPLHMAVQSGNAEVIELLLKNNADPIKRNDELVSPTRMAAMTGMGGNELFYDALVKASGGQERFEPIDPKIRDGKSIDELIRATKSKFATPEGYQATVDAGLGLVSYGAEAVKPISKAMREDPNNGQLLNALVKLGPQAREAMPLLEEMLKSKERVVVGWITLRRIEPGYFEKLPEPTKQQADASLLAATVDSKLRPMARYMSHMLSDASALKLLESDEPELKEIAGAIATTRPDSVLFQRAAEYQLGVAKNWTTDPRRGEQAIAWLGGRKKVSTEAIEVFWQILRNAPEQMQKLDGRSKQRRELQNLTRRTGRALGGVLTKDSLTDLLPMLSPIDSPERSGALAALQSVKPELLSDVVEWLQHEDDSVATSAMVVLGKRSKQHVMPLLLPALKQYDDRGRVNVLRTMYELHPFEEKPTLLRIVKNEAENLSVRAIAAIALLRMGEKLTDAERKEVQVHLPAVTKCIFDEASPARMPFVSRLPLVAKDAAAAIPVLKAYLRENPLPDYDENPKRWQELYPIQAALREVERALSESPE